MRRKVMNVVMSVLVFALCALAFTGCSPQESALRGVGDEQATKIVCYGETKDNAQKRTTYMLDGDKLLIREENVVTSKNRVTRFKDMLFWKDGETLRCIERDVTTYLESIQNDVYSQSYRNMLSDDSKYAESEKTNEELKEIYDTTKAMFDVSGKTIGKEIDADKELYKGKDFKFATSKDAMNAGDFLEKAKVDDKEKVVKRWTVEDKKLIAKRDELANLSYSYTYDSVTVNVPSRFTASN